MFPLDPISTQLLDPSTTGVARAETPPLETGLSEGLATFAKGLGSIADLYKAREFQREKKYAELQAARGNTAPGLVSQDAIDAYNDGLDNRLATQIEGYIKTFTENDGLNIANSSLTSIEKADRIEVFQNGVHEKLKYITNNPKALAKVMNALDLSRMDLYYKIANYDLRNVEQTGIANIIDFQREDIETSIENNKKRPDLPPQRGLNVKRTNEYIQHLVALKTKHRFKNVNGKKVQVFSRLDEFKAVLSVQMNLVLENYNNDPKLVEDFELVFNAIYKDMMLKEEAIITKGRSDTIGDVTTIRSMLNNYYTKLDALQTESDSLETDAVIKDINKIVLDLMTTGQRDISDEQKAAISTRCGEYNIECINKAITKVKKFIEHPKYEVNSPQYNEILNWVLTNELKSAEVVRTYALHKHLTNDAINSLVSDFTTKKDHINTIKSDLEQKTPQFTWPRIYKAIKEAKISNVIVSKLKGMGVDLSAAIEFTQFQNLVSKVDRIKEADDILAPLKETAKFITDTREKIMTLSRQAAYRRDDPTTKDIVESEVTSQELEIFIAERNKEFKRILEQYTALVTKEIADIKRREEEGQE